MVLGGFRWFKVVPCFSTYRNREKTHRPGAPTVTSQKFETLRDTRVTVVADRRSRPSSTILKSLHVILQLTERHAITFP